VNLASHAGIAGVLLSLVALSSGASAAQSSVHVSVVVQPHCVLAVHSAETSTPAAGAARYLTCNTLSETNAPAPRIRIGSIVPNAVDGAIIQIDL